MEKMRKSAQEAILWPWFERCDRICIDATGLGIGWSDDAQDRFGTHRVEAVTFTGPVKEALAYPLRGAMEDRAVRIPDDAIIRADLRKVQKVVTAAGNIRFVAESTPDGHADRFWALALALHAGSVPSGPVIATTRPQKPLQRIGGINLNGY
jgi:phage FluMu gp28-like protein